MIQLNHIGIAVQDLPAMQRLFALLGLMPAWIESVPDQGVVTHFYPLPLADGALELLEPSDPKGAVSQFISKRGPGVHHLSFMVDKGEMDLLCANLRSNGYRLVYDEAKQGAQGMRINFIHPATSGGVLVELMEKG